MTDVVHVLPLAYMRPMVPAPNCVIFRFTIADGEEFSFGLDNIGRTAPSLSLNVKVGKLIDTSSCAKSQRS